MKSTKQDTLLDKIEAIAGKNKAERLLKLFERQISINAAKGGSKSRRGISAPEQKKLQDAQKLARERKKQ